MRPLVSLRDGYHSNLIIRLPNPSLSSIYVTQRPYSVKQDAATTSASDEFRLEGAV